MILVVLGFHLCVSRRSLQLTLALVCWCWLGFFLLVSVGELIFDLFLTSSNNLTATVVSNAATEKKKKGPGGANSGHVVVLQAVDAAGNAVSKADMPLCHRMGKDPIRGCWSQQPPTQPLICCPVSQLGNQKPVPLEYEWYTCGNNS